MNFGNKLLLVFAAFAAMMIYMVYRCVAIPVDLVSKEYYKDEIAYQQVIDGTNNANALSAAVKLVHLDGAIKIQFPNEMKHQDIKGTVYFYCAANDHKDKHFPLSPNQDGEQQIITSQLKKGNYTVKIDWLNKGNHYYNEQPITIN